MATAATMRFLDVWYARVDIEDLLAELSATADKATLKAAQKNLAKARKKTSLGSLAKFAERIDGGYRIKEQPPIIVRPPELMRAEAEGVVRQGLADYAHSLAPDRRVVLDHYHYADFARKVVGVGSVGTEAFMLLLMGDREDDPLFLQIKEADTSVLAPYAGASEYEHQGERVVQGQRLLQTASDAFLGWVTGTGERHREFYVRQLRDMKGSAAVETMPPERLARYGELCGATLARAHARTGDAAKISGYLGDDDTFDRALEQFAVAYADQNDADYAGVHQRRRGAAHRRRTRRVTHAGSRDRPTPTSSPLVAGKTMTATSSPPKIISATRVISACRSKRQQKVDHHENCYRGQRAQRGFDRARALRGNARRGGAKSARSARPRST